MQKFLTNINNYSMMKTSETFGLLIVAIRGISVTNPSVASWLSGTSNIMSIRLTACCRKIVKSTPAHV
ncbi:hypothetical protein [uncultured Psychrosphaera sp.]|uniref:hypothetical protein n=1 Tax=uncultured Psychrosphaera sp. TaxID=1403522 RepID=UPI0030F8E22E